MCFGVGLALTLLCCLTKTLNGIFTGSMSLSPVVSALTEPCSSQHLFNIMISTRWAHYFMREARNAASMSKDPSSQVGAVLVKERRIVGTGFNGFPRGVKDDIRLWDRDKKIPRIVHAEMNAILNAGRDAEGSTLFMYGFSGAPCANCTKHLLQAGIVQVYVCGPDLPERWRRDVDISLDMMREADIPVLDIAPEDLDRYTV